LENYEAMIKIGSKQGQHSMHNNVGKTGDSLIKKVNDMRVNGMTALGPALTIAAAMAAEGTSGSQVIICTDG